MIILKPKRKKIDIYISKSNEIYYEGSFTLIKSYKLLIDNISIQKYHKKVSINDKKLLEILKKDKVILTDENDTLIRFLDEENISYTIQHVCDSCLQYKVTTLLLTSEEYTLYRKTYCKYCASEYLEDVIENNEYTNFTESRVDLLLNKYHDLTKILDIIENNYDLLSNPDLTLVDVLPATEEEYEKIHVNSLDIPYKLKQVLNKKFDYLLPVQVKAVKSGLLDDENLLVVSSTASGKTLIGELAGITKCLEEKKMIYLTPLVALANQKYRDFKRDYEQLGLKVVIKVGRNRVKTDEELNIVEESVSDADIIVATYEGLDYILRSGKYNVLNELGVVVIDEIHMLDDEERGHRLNGLVHRLLSLFKDAQLIALSATIQNAHEVAETFNMSLVSYDKRPVKIERHIVPLYLKEKMNFIKTLCLKEFNNVSSKNYHGQTIIFTDSRRNTEIISKFLDKNGVSAASYHAGLTYNRKLEIEESFIKQELSAIVTTSALSNGIDFPASQVIFDSLRMGFEWLTPNELHQMLGRAGRPSYHDTGKVYLLPVMDRYSANEYYIAQKLINSSVQDVNVLYNANDVYEQVLADICAMGRTDLNSLRKVYDELELPVTFKEAVNELNDINLIKVESDNTAIPTEYGFAVSKSFISINIAEFVKNHLLSDILEVSLNIEQIKNVYLSDSLLKSFNKAGLYPNIRLFSGENRYAICKGKILDVLDKKTRNFIINMHNDFFICDCWDSPRCNCLEKNISEHIINRRLQGWSPSEISKEFKKEYSLVIYPGDVYSFLDQTIRFLDVIKRIARVYKVDSTIDDCVRTIKKLEG